MKTLQYKTEDNGHYDLITVYSEDGNIFTELEAGKFPDNERFLTDEDEIQLYLDVNGYDDEEFEIRPLTTTENNTTMNDINFIELEIKQQIPYPVGRDMPITIEIVQQMCDKLKILYKEDEVIQLVVRGSSGAIIGGLVASILNDRNIVTITHIKKEGESSHSSGIYNVENIYPIVIIDDLISSGTTVNEIYKALNDIGYYDVDTLCVSRDVGLRRLNFKPKNIIAGIIYEN